MINKRLIKKCKYDVVIHCMWFCFTLGQIYTLSMRTARKTYHFLGKKLRAVARITGRGRAGGDCGVSPALRDGGGEARGLITGCRPHYGTGARRGGLFTGCRPHYGTGTAGERAGRPFYGVSPALRDGDGEAVFTGCRPHYGTGASGRGRRADERGGRGRGRGRGI